jgi:uncharacterized sulfatase
MDLHSALRKTRAIVVGAVLLVVSAPAILTAAKAAPRRDEPPEPSTKPNVLLVISDDQAWTDFGFMGHPVIETPHLDELARQGAAFTRGYVPTALCRPSLATIVTGLYPHQHGITGNDPAIRTDAQGPAYWEEPRYRELNERLQARIERLPTLPRLLGRHGYVSHQSGKWWEGSYRRGGFTAGMTHGDPDRGGRHGDDGLTIGREGLQPIFDFIDGAGERPFFVWYAPFLPHWPHDPPARLLDKYVAADRPIELSRYYAMCEWLDETVGELLGHLDEKGHREDTLVVFVTDNGWIQRTPETEVPDGWELAFAPRSKQSPYDGGTRTPIILRWPGVIEPARFDTVVSSIDLAPTILAAAGLDPHPTMPGVNLLDVVRGVPVDREVIFGEGFAHDIADVDAPRRSLLYRWCIEGPLKLLLTSDGQVGRYDVVHPQTRQRIELYDLEADPFENRNLADDRAEDVARLSRRIAEWWNLAPRPGP